MLYQLKKSLHSLFGPVIIYVEGGGEEKKKGGGSRLFQIG